MHGGSASTSSCRVVASPCMKSCECNTKENIPMKWITREHVKVDRVACPWLIKRFVDPGAEFYFVPAEHVIQEAERLNAIPFDVAGVELGHHGKQCSFEAILQKYNLNADPALHLLG